MNETNTQALPLLITRGIVIYPRCTVQLDVGRAFSINAVNFALSQYESQILIISQVDPYDEKVEDDKLYHIGTLCTISSVRDSKDILKVRVLGSSRVKVSNIVEPEDDKDSYFATYEVLENAPSSDINKEDDMMQEVLSILTSFSDIALPTSLLNKLNKGVTPEDFAYQISSVFPFALEQKQAILEENSVLERLIFLKKVFADIGEMDKVEKEVNQKVREKTEKQQKEYYLREKLKATQEELEKVTGENEASEEETIMKKLEEGNYPENVKKKIKVEFSRFKLMPPASMEYGMAKTYIDWLVDLPWANKTEDNDDLNNAKKILDEDHYGLEEVKERIIEYLAVKAQTKSLKAPILCLYGAPGVGKTSLAKSIARALNRKFVKASLGGLYDESELRGHRRTYVGAMPGKIIKGIKNAGVCNPVFLLDEIDKMASSNKGDPSSALLEILDPEQNSIFQDNYIEETYDLSNVLFIATANYLQNIPGPLRDRLELIEIASYTDVEKYHIAREHLISKQAEINGLSLDKVDFTDGAIYSLIHNYTREAGVRSLEREIASVCRKCVVELLKDPSISHITIDDEKIKSYLGQYKFEYSTKESDDQVGIVTGLAYTEFGGDILPIEVTHFAGKGEFILTGNLGNVMKESASIALDYVKANAEKYGINPEFFQTHTIHIHVPEGAVPKDGPSAGVALTTAVISSLTNKKVKATVAMTGEVNLRGLALPIGGLREKTLAALRSGIKTVIIPRKNEKDLEKISSEVKSKLQIVLMDNVDDALKVAFGE